MTRQGFPEPAESPVLDLQRFIENINVFSNWDDRYKYIISLGRQLKPLSEGQHADAHLVKGCMSQVWLFCPGTQALDDPFKFYAHSNAAIVNGLIMILQIILKDKSAADVLSTDIKNIYKDLELDQHLSPGRSNGFFSMVQDIQQSILGGLEVDKVADN
mgnify:CR=1 FL=1